MSRYQTEIINIETIVHETKKRWLQEEAPSKPIRYRIAESVPYWIMLVAFALFILSASHTAQMFKSITGEVGIVATIVVEFGLLYAAAQRRLAKSKDGQVDRVVWLFEILLIFTAVLVNGIGSLITATESTGLRELSAPEVLAAFGSLPLATQGALILAMLAAVIIPTGVIAAGEQVAKLMLESEAHADDYRERRWQDVQETIIYRAVFAHYRNIGMDAKTAGKAAKNEVRAYLQSGRVSASKMLSAPVRADNQMDKRTTDNGQTTDRNTDKTNRKRTKVRTYFEENPELLEGYPVRELVAILNGQGIECARQMVNEVRNEVRAYLQSVETN